MRFRAPANVLLHRAQITLILAALIPTMLTTPIGILLLASGGSASVALVAGVLVLAFCASTLGGFILGSILLRRGASLVRVQTDFFSSVSHELRTPMTSMRMFIEALLDDRLTDPEERKRCLSVLGEELARLDGLVGRLLDLSRIESGAQAFSREPLAVETIVDRSLAAFEAIALGGTAQLDREVEPGLRIVGDEAALTQAIVNLLANAWKYSGDDKKISLSARSAGSREIEIVVVDNGPGIPTEERKKVFEKFERGKAAVESGTQGSGLGLSIVQAVVKAHRGRVDVRSPSSGGTRVHIHLPRYREEVANG